MPPFKLRPTCNLHTFTRSDAMNSRIHQVFRYIFVIFLIQMSPLIRLLDRFVIICSFHKARPFNIHTKAMDYLLTYSTVQSPSWETNWFAASQEIPRISRNPKVHYRTHKRPPTVSILDQPNPVHIPTTHLLESHPNIIHPSTPRSLQWSLSLRFPHQDPIHPALLTHTRHMPSPSHSSRFYHPHNIGWAVQII